MNITKQKAAELIRSQGHQIFTVQFVKKNGDLRTMNCRLKVKKHWTTPDGSGGRYKPSDYGLICVFDMQKKGYRTINLETLQTLRIAGTDYSITQG